ncbi:exodeoxyribonuclease V subunit beta [Buchnera aphidicola]|uniref:exodeoxyribonuclease V subunit beta n=1 Tax=Buchnera aphidicola TaxID=9 RepID=UPI002092E92C|nr:exodeoxyribonuclease V subunit beta [Buchnera aphidicola]USS94033.1 exodeoxyribonuclease V subunit beta [Buchnera aphidicola (Sipha maydis)]
MNKKNKILDIFSIKLNGIKMIEASAGTGKTFTTILLYLRILLGINQDEKEKYSMKNILIITYTKNAVKEIKKRLEKNIYNLYLACLSKKTNDKNHIKILKKIKNFNQAIQILKKAYINIHDASIYTIHGFCKHILKKKNYNFQYLIKNKKKVYDENFLYKKATYIFWRNFFYPYNKEISQIIFQSWKNPEELFTTIQHWINIKSKFFLYTKNKKDKITDRHKKNITTIQKFKKKWKVINFNLKKIFYKNKLNKRIYHKKNFYRWTKKIKIWSKEKTKNYIIPQELTHFSKKKIEKNISTKKKYIFLKIIDKFLKKKFCLKEVILMHAIKKISEICKKIKKKNFSYDNLIESLLKLLKNEKNLSAYIKKKFPIAVIDEFQDTNMQQYKIFQKIYQKKNFTLILIGDPKQSIYNFRGADIFFYLKVKSKIKKIYTLNTNWRSSKKLIECINFLFTRIKNSFLFKQINFTSLITPKKSEKKKYFIKKIEQPSIKLWLQSKTIKTSEEYNNWIAKKCSQDIYFLLKKIKKSQAILENQENKKKLKIQDICILVKNYDEYKIMKKELLKFSISSYYTSYNKSIFQTNEIQEMYFILKSIAYPSNDNYFNKAISTEIISKNSYLIHKIKKKYSLWSKLKEKFLKYKHTWKDEGILNLIKKIISQSYLYENYFFRDKCQNKISNIIHLGKILEKKSSLRREISSILSWIKKKIYRIENKKKYQQKLYNNKNVINITTIYKSKGLEYPIVWVPFISNFNISKKYIFHDRKRYNTFINLCQSKKKIKLEKEEKLSEEIRLLYVALTRAIFQCNLGISPICINKKNKKTSFHNSGLGYILQKGEKMNAKKLYQEINKITKNQSIKLIFKKEKIPNKKIQKKIKKRKKNYIFLKFDRIFEKNINTSYTKILKLSSIKKKFSDKFNKLMCNQKTYEKKINLKNFPKGKKIGKMLHKILEKISFHKKINKKFIQQEIKKNKLKKNWTIILKKWIQDILIHPLSIRINLLILKNKCIKEMEFYLPLKKEINFVSINSILEEKKKSINQINTGFLKGFIDLIFKFKNKYYFVDYKSNFLGKKKSDYKEKKLKKYFFKKKYNIQFYLYSIALHRFLQKKIHNYNFKKNFGGGYYLFLRGMDGKNINQGVFFLVPQYKLMKKIEHTFLKQSKY